MSKSATTKVTPVVDTSAMGDYFQLYNIEYMSFNLDTTGIVYKVDKTEGSRGAGKFLQEGWDEYIEQIYSQIEVNKIAPTDKVFFLSNSNFPRTIYNKYSPTSKRVEIIKNADKVVLSKNKNFFTRAPIWGAGSLSGVYLKDDTNNKVYEYDSQSLWEVLNKSLVIGNLIGGATLKKTVANTYYNSRYLLQEWVKVLNANTPIKWSIVIPSVFTLSVQEKTWNQLIDNVINISDIVFDEEANLFLDQYKRELDPSNVEMISNLLVGDKPNITLGLKVLENLNVENTKPELYSLLLKSFIVNEAVIRRTKAWDSVGIKNMRKQYHLDVIKDMHYGNSAARIEVISKIHSKLAPNEGTRFKYEIKDLFVNELKSYLGVNAVDLLSNIYKDSSKQN